jgi:hypothetical protein
MVEAYLKNLYKVYQYRLSVQQDTPQLPIPQPAQQTGTSLTARELALSVMNNPQPKNYSVTPLEGPKDDSNPLMNLGREILDSGPVKGALDILSRPSYAVGGVFEALNGGKTPSAAGSVGEVNSRMSHIPREFWEGLSGADHTTVSEVMNRNPDYQKQPGPLKFAQGLVADIATDPTTYIPVAGAVNAGKKLLRAGKAGKEVAQGAPIAEKAIETAPVDAPAPTAVEAITPTPTPDPLQEALQKVPIAAHPQIDTIDSPFKTVTKETPVAESPSLAIRRAIKAALLQSDAHVINGKWKIGDLLRVAKESPEKQAQIDKLFNQEVNSIYKSKEYGPLYRGKKAAVALQFMNSRGNVVGGLNLKQLHSLFKEGNIGTGADDALGLPIHDPEDLKAFFLNNAKGETVSLHQYLEDLGVGIKAGDKEIIKAAPPKTVIEKSTVAPTTADIINWSTAHSGKLSAKELAHLSQATSPDEFATRLNELKAKTAIKGFGSPKEFVEAVKQGIIPAASAEKIYDTVGAKNLDDFIAKAEAITKKTGKGAATDVVERLSDANPESLRAANAEWETPTQLIEKAATGDTTALTKAKPSITPQIVEDLSHALPHAIVENLIDPQDLAKYPFVTTKKLAKRTDKTMFEGRARNLHGWHGISQTDVFRTLARRAAARHGKSGLKSKEFIEYARMRADLMYNDIMPAMRVAEAALKDQGVKFIAGNQETGIMLSLVDTLDALGPELTKKFLFGIGHNRPQALPTSLLDAMEHLVRSSMSKGNMDVARLAAEKALAVGPRMTDASAKRFVNAMIDKLPVAMQRVSANYAEASIKMGEAVKSMSDQTIDQVIKKFVDPNVSMGDALGEISQRVNFSSKIGRELKAPDGAGSVAKGIIDTELASKGVDAQGLVEADTAKRFENADKTAVKKTGVDQQASRAVSGMDGAGDTIADLSDVMDVRLQAGIFRANVPLLNKLLAAKDGLGRSFSTAYGNEALHYMVHQNRNVTQSFARMHRGIMQNTYEIAKKAYGPQANERLAEAFKHLQANTPIDDPAMRQIMDSMKQSLDIMFDGSGNGHGAFAARNGIFAEHLNEVMLKYGVPKEILFDVDAPLVEQVGVWRGWTDVSDPLDILDKTHAAFQRATIDVTVGRDFSDAAHEWVSNTAKPGFVKIADTKGKSTLFRFIDDSKYYDKDVVAQLPYLENVLNGTFLSHDRAGLLSMYDSVLHAWKAGVTIYRPGHHVRNLIGDVGLSFLAGVYNPGAYKTSARILAGRASAYKEWDAFKSLQTLSKGPVDIGKTKLRVSIGGKRVAFDDDKLWRAAFNQGILPDFSVLEDIAFNDTQKLKIGGISLMKPFGGRVQKAAGGLSQSRDHWVRMAHFVDSLQKGNYRSFEEAVNKAGATVRKWHPDGSDLTAFERQAMRRVIPFYSWFRKAIPLVVEAVAMQPGRALVVPKAMQNFALQMGVDPESLGNPFPTDQLFPDWLEDNTLGPQWRGNLGIPGFGQYDGRYYGLNPGDPVTDLGNSFLGASPVNSLLGGLTPVAKIPLELSTGSILGTGSSITDTSDYVDAQIPGISQVANMTNTSVTGGDPQYDVQKGRSAAGMDEIAMTNFLTGLGIKDYSKPNYIKSAQLEMRDKLRGR